MVILDYIPACDEQCVKQLWQPLVDLESQLKFLSIVDNGNQALRFN